MTMYGFADLQADSAGSPSWLYPAVEALSAITTSAAPLEFKLQSACRTLTEKANAAGVWIIGTSFSAPEILCTENSNADVLQAIDAKDQTRHREIIQAMAAMTLKTHLSHSPLTDRRFSAAGRFFVATCCPLISHGRAIGGLICLLEPEDVRSDMELSQIRVCARILAMAIGSSAEFTGQQQNSQWSRRFEALTAVLPGASVILSPTGRVTSINGGQETVPGLDDLRKSFDMGSAARDGVTPAAGPDQTRRQQEAFKSAMQGRIARCHVNHQIEGEGRMRVIEHRFSPVADHRGATSEVALFARDVTDIAAMKQSIRDLTERDSITGSMTMAALIERARDHIVSGGVPGKQTVFMSIEVTGSATGVHLFGNEAFEELLQGIYSRISKSLPGVDAIARRGERNFVAMIDVADGKKFATEAAGRLVNELRGPLVTGRKEHAMSVTVGYAIFPGDGHDADEMFRHADIAASNAHRAGRNSSLPFKWEMARDADERTQLESRLYHAVENEEFTLAFQPKVRLCDGTVAGVEALLRWNGTNGISPSRFIPIAEECGLILYIGEWVLRQACRTARRWADSGLRIPISVNVSTRQFQDNDFHSVVDEILTETGCDPSLIDLEVTEGVMFSDPDAAIRSFNLLKEMGVSISIDDFGTGFSSLSYLKSLPADCVKIDRTFIMGLPSDGNSAAISKAIIAMAKAMNICVVAEGVEEVQCLNYLKELGCDQVQGYYYSKPLFEAEFLAWLDDFRQKAAETGQVGQANFSGPSQSESLAQGLGKAMAPWISAPRCVNSLKGEASMTLI